VRGTTNPASVLPCIQRPETAISLHSQLLDGSTGLPEDHKQLDLRPADPFTRTDPKLNQVVLWPLHTFPENFMQIGPAVYFSRNVADKETNKETKKVIGGGAITHQV